uniref:Uncharacterized protein n=1 Tax=Bartonella schoenbuchensis (strain DSM 13525 / NCTC 13165 / R1) TaxID=687861 RepID=E6Z1C6_BARSR|nr:hypothetical protein BARSC_190187 [Bartonella schoenbuchensis R1]
MLWKSVGERGGRELGDEEGKGVLCGKGWVC